MKLKKLVALILALVTALSLVACGSGGNGSGGGASTDGDTSNFPKMTWSAATSGAEGSNFDVGLEKFSELLQEKTGGAIKLDIYCSDQLTNGNQADSIQANIDGTIDVTFQADGVWGNFDTVFSVPNLPFLFDNYDDVDSKLINGEGGKYLMNAMDSKFNVKCLGIGENGFRYLTNSKHPVKTPDDLHDLKLRIGGAPILVSTYESWGVDYTTAAWAEVYTGLQTKLYDGQENPIAVADASSSGGPEVCDRVDGQLRHHVHGHKRRPVQQPLRRAEGHRGRVRQGGLRLSDPVHPRAVRLRAEEVGRQLRHRGL